MFVARTYLSSRAKLVIVSNPPIIAIESRDYHQLSQVVIGGGKRIYQYLSGPTPSARPARPIFRLRDCIRI